ncbi:hypothetical protein SCMU_34080 [Sinomonas cyclohexanicum]|uniref:Lipoprotein with Yx(FWY)xxD motif n=1 Tax=Sinomonas cyclohexanicum TaxID=322009 RepID=A0ABM7PZ35_SINCY|nr:hypothetical protein [Corynebacterium cyclohexanicum]BCT77566.1 hypothetical protein SCMU_34080 [Corynebacterium cyclohexanicum]
MNKRAALWMAAAWAIPALALAGCGSSTSSGAASSGGTTSSSSAASGSDNMGYGAGGSAASGSASASSGGSAQSGTSETLKTATIGGQTIVVDGQGKVVYYYTRDNAGATVSACTGGCATLWPAVTSADAPTLQGVTAKVGSIKTADGKSQVTLNGMPIYFYQKDTAPGQANGQGVASVWYVIGADGTMITTALK